MWRPWEGDDEVESNVNACVPSTSRSKTITGRKCMGTLNKQSQKIICNVYAYVKSNKLGKGPITESAKAVGLSRQAVSRVVERGPKTPKKCKNKKQEFEKVDNFICDVIRRTVYDDFFLNGQSPTVSEILIERKKKCEFPYKETTLRELLKKLGFRFRVLNKRRVIMESSRIVTWRYKYLNTLRSKRSAGHKIIFLDETWYDTHDVPKKGWDDGCCSCAFNAPVSRGKRIMVLHAGSSDGWVPNCLFLSARNIGDSKADSHDEMNSEIFEDWFTNKLMKNLPTSPPCIIVTDNAAYHSRLQFRLPNRSTRKDDIISFMVQHNLEVPNPLPTMTREIERQYIVRDSENDRDSFIISVGDSDSEGSSSDES
ncbi:hypothetical protein ANN_01777 [Periplaneta americana]|uniref:Tc1-like transposase DDE domain-containing protein n=1 Tax=Periplaneta americana TaxID=6978 RepID=A0ABQ8TUG9_PERAM|nr:hypothetical protein ANN_01777 [Periplaneta americana]